MMDRRYPVMIQRRDPGSAEQGWQVLEEVETSVVMLEEWWVPKSVVAQIVNFLSQIDYEVSRLKEHRLVVAVHDPFLERASS